MIVTIPGEITFSRTYNIPPVAVELPLTAHARTWQQGFLTAIGVCLAMPVLVLFVLFLSVAVAVTAHGPGSAILFFCALAFLLLAFLPIALFGLEDVTRRGPTLVLDAHGLTDRRAGLTLPWTEIAAARIVAGRNETRVRLRLRTPVPPRPLFDRGGEGLLGRRDADEFRVLISRLSVRPHVLGQTILALVRMGGGSVEG